MEMTRCVTSSEMKKIEDGAMGPLFGITGQLLMGLAGKAIADEVQKKFPPEIRVSVICGKGNNGGDGFAAASFLSAAGYSCLVWQAEADTAGISPASSFFLSLCRTRNLVAESKPDFADFPCILDCLTGIGLKGTVKQNLSQIITEINNSGSFVISADLPSGLRADGPIDRSAAVVRADVTVTMGLPKVNSVQYPGRSYTGRLVTADLGFPKDIVGQTSRYKTFIMDRDGFDSISINEPSVDAHKYDNGHLAILGGFKGMEGAALLAAQAAFQTGVGLLTIYTEEQSRKIMAGKIPEAMTAALPEQASDEELRDFFTDQFLKKKIRVLLMGCGMGRELYQERVFHAVFAAAAGLVPKIVLDGDALWLLSRAGSPPERKGSELIITPHAGECSRLLGRESAEIADDIHGAAVDLSSLFDCIAVLKGPTTVTAGKERCFINMSGNQSLATAGSGDVLAGICSALQLRKIPSDIAAAVSVYIHGAAADSIVKKTGTQIICSSEVIDRIRDILYQSSI